MRIFHSWRYPINWAFFRSDDRLLLILIGSVVGSLSGIASVLLNRSLETIGELLHPFMHCWWFFLLPATGAALSSLFLEKIVKEGAGHGVPEVIYSISRYGGLLRLRSSFSRLISSFLTIGSGGSAGPEAPVVMSGSAIGSNIARLFSLNDRQRITLVGCGAAGAISSIFNAPIAGMVFSIEVIIGEWKSVNIIPIAVASVAGTEISRILQGNQIAFDHRMFDLRFADISASLGLAVLTVVASVIFTRALRAMSQISKKCPVSLWQRAALGGIVVGLTGLLFPVALGEGYHPVKEMITGAYTQGLSIVFLAVAAKIFATSMTLGWGGSGGIFAPCLVIGSLTGLVFHRFIVLLMPSVSLVNEGCFALLGMAGLISGVMQAPLTGIFLIVEITSGYEVILPLILISTISATLCHYIEPVSFYFKELAERGGLLRPGTDAGVLSVLSAQEVIEKDCIAVPQNMLLRDFIEIIKGSHRNYFPVEDEKDGRFLGLIHLDDIRQYIFNPFMYDAVFIGQITNTRVKVVSLDDDLSDVLNIMDKDRLFSIPVVSNGKFIGMISKATLLDQYRKELMVQTTIM